MIFPHGSNESEMELVIDLTNNLQQNMDMKTPEMVKKYVSEHHASRYSGIEQQHYIHAQTARIVCRFPFCYYQLVSECKLNSVFVFVFFAYRWLNEKQNNID